ncbi:MAG: hypothetical protein ACRED6_02615 [Stellaceae bacterium]
MSDDILGVSTMNGGLIVSVAFSTEGIRVQDAVYHQLVDKFGAPTQTRIDQAQNAFGARFEVRNAQWDFGAFTVKFYGSDGRIDHGGVEMTSATYAAAEAKWKTHQNATEPKM